MMRKDTSTRGRELVDDETWPCCIIDDRETGAVNTKTSANYRTIWKTPVTYLEVARAFSTSEITTWLRYVFGGSAHTTQRDELEGVSEYVAMIWWSLPLVIVHQARGRTYDAPQRSEDF